MENQDTIRTSYTIELFPTQKLAEGILRGDYDVALTMIYGMDALCGIKALAQKVWNMNARPPLQSPLVLLVPGNTTTQLLRDNGSREVIWFDLWNLLRNPWLMSRKTKNYLTPAALLPAISLYYVRMAFNLALNGYVVEILVYDWRLSLSGRQTAIENWLIYSHERTEQFVRAGGKGPFIHMITHSEGGLAGRGALRTLSKRPRFLGHFGQLIMIAPPSRGCWTLLQALAGDPMGSIATLLSPCRWTQIFETLQIMQPLYPRFPKLKQAELGITVLATYLFFQGVNVGTYIPLLKDLIRRGERDIARMLNDIVTPFICTFPGYYQTMPFYDAPELNPTQQEVFYNANQWPSGQPEQILLDMAKNAQTCFPPAPTPGDLDYGRWKMVLGTGVRTLTNVYVGQDKFLFDYTTDGDGEIALNLALMRNMEDFTYKFEGLNHLQLIKSPKVIQLLLKILSSEEQSLEGQSSAQQDQVPSNPTESVQAASN